jgi:hypothetical protein
MSGRKQKFQQFFPCVPTLMSWEEWNGNLAIYYGQTNIMMSPEENWKAAAQNIAESQSFNVYPIPSPDKYDNWQDWALDFTELINGPTH